LAKHELTLAHPAWRETPGQRIDHTGIAATGQGGVQKGMEHRAVMGDCSFEADNNNVAMIWGFPLIRHACTDPGRPPGGDGLAPVPQWRHVLKRHAIQSLPLSWCGGPPRNPLGGAAWSAALTLDVQTILVVLLTNVIATSIALPVIVGWNVSRSARLFQGASVAQAFGWAAFLVAPSINDRWVTSLSFAFLSASFVMLWYALQGWLRHRPGRRLMLALAVLTPLGYGLTYDSYPVRVGWANFGLALQMAVLCVSAAWPARSASRRWRGLLFLCMASLTLVTAWRGVLGAFFTESYPFFRATHPINIVAVLLYHVALALSTVALLVAWREEAERELTRRAHTDGLTGLLNRQAFADRAEDLTARARRYGEPLSLVMIDIDHFKLLNDTRGHAAGDEALKTLGHGLRACVRKGDLVCRHGGEEFCVLLSRADANDATLFDARLREWLDQHAPTPADRIEFSSGSALLADQDADLDDLVRRADAALYRAKAEGRARLAHAV
jgi:diguanylate cyclase (GGDEF)-like protein